MLWPLCWPCPRSPPPHPLCFSFCRVSREFVKGYGRHTRVGSRGAFGGTKGWNKRKERARGRGAGPWGCRGRVGAETPAAGVKRGAARPLAEVWRETIPEGRNGLWADTACGTEAPGTEWRGDSVLREGKREGGGERRGKGK